MSRFSPPSLVQLFRLGLGTGLVVLAACHNEIDFHNSEDGEPACQIQESTIDFGSLVADGSFADRTFTIRNIGGGQMTGTIRVDTDQVSILAGGGTYTLGPGQLRRVTLRYRPDRAGDLSAQVRVGSPCRSVSLQGTAEPPIVCGVSPLDLDFGTVTTDGSFNDKTFAITNPGTVALIGSVSIACDGFSIVQGGGDYSLGPGQSRNVTVRFQPTNAGGHQCLVETGAAACADVTANGIGENPPACQVDLDRFDFGVVNVGSSATQSFNISNTGGGILSGNVQEACPDFTITAGGGGFALAAGQSRQVTVRYAPSAIGPDSCRIDLGASCPGPDFLGRGDSDPVCDISPGSLNFGTVVVGGSSVDRSFTITNNGGQALAGSVTEACAEFSIVSGGGAFSLGAGAQRTVTVRLTATSSGPKSCTINTGTALCSNVTASGTAELPPECELSTTSLDFGTIVADGSNFADRSFTIRNVGEGTLTGSVSEFCSHYTIISGSGSYSLTAGQTRTVTVRFQPADESFGTLNCSIETGASCASNVSATGVGAVGFFDHIQPRVATSCALAGCHNGATAGVPDWRIYANASSSTYVNIADPASSLLLRKPAGQANPDGAHGGGTVSGWTVGSANYNITFLWIQQGVRQ